MEEKLKKEEQAVRLAEQPGAQEEQAVRQAEQSGAQDRQPEIHSADRDGQCAGQPMTEDAGCSACCQHRTKERSEKEYRDLLNRLSRIEGQIRGIRRMVENDAYCTDILIQVSAVNAALNSFNKVLLANHIRTCVAEDIREGREETIDELVATLQKLMK